MNLLTNTFVFLIRLHTLNYYSFKPNTQILQHRWQLASLALWRPLNYWDSFWGKIWSTTSRISSPETESNKPWLSLRRFTISRGVKTFTILFRVYFKNQVHQTFYDGNHDLCFFDSRLITELQIDGLKIPHLVQSTSQTSFLSASERLSGLPCKWTVCLHLLLPITVPLTTSFGKNSWNLSEDVISI